MAKTGAAIQVANNGLCAMNKVIGLTTTLVAETIPWKELKETVQELNKNQDQYSTEAEALVRKIAQALLDSRDQYVTSVNTVDGWCISATNTIPVLLGLFANITDKDAAKAQVEIFVKLLNSGEEAISKALGEMNASNESFKTMAAKIEELQPQLEADSNEASAFFKKAVADVRTKAYAGAYSGVIFGLIGLAVSYAIAAGIVEGELVPNLKRAFKETQAAFDKLKKDLEKSEDSIQAAKELIKKEIKDLKTMNDTIEKTEGFAEDWAGAPSQHFDSFKDSTSELIKLCTDYSAVAEKKRSNKWI